MEENYISFKTRICCHLNYLVSIKRVKTYGEVVTHCEIPSPRKIRKLNAYLIDITEEDIKNERPLRAALVVSKIANLNYPRLPNEEFFNLLKKHKIYDGKNEVSSYLKFHKELLKSLLI